MSKLFTRLRGAPKFPYLEKGNVSPTLSVPSSIRLPPYVNNKKFDPTVTTGFDISPTTIKNEVQISAMRRTGKLAAQILDYATSLVKVIISIISIRFFYQLFVKLNQEISTKNFELFNGITQNN